MPNRQGNLAASNRQSRVDTAIGESGGDALPVAFVALDGTGEILSGYQPRTIRPPDRPTVRPQSSQRSSRQSPRPRRRAGTHGPPLTHAPPDSITTPPGKYQTEGRVQPRPATRTRWGQQRPSCRTRRARSRTMTTGPNNTVASAVAHPTRGHIWPSAWGPARLSQPQGASAGVGGRQGVCGGAEGAAHGGHDDRLRGAGVEGGTPGQDVAVEHVHLGGVAVVGVHGDGESVFAACDAVGGLRAVGAGGVGGGRRV